MKWTDNLKGSGFVMIRMAFHGLTFHNSRFARSISDD